MVDLKAQCLASPGSGRLVSKLICMVPDLEAARDAWDGFYAAPRRIDLNWAHYAFAARLDEAGLEQEVMAFMADMVTAEGVEAVDIDQELERTINRWLSER